MFRKICERVKRFLYTINKGAIKAAIKLPYMDGDLTTFKITIHRDDTDIIIKVLKHSYLIEYENKRMRNREHYVFEVWGILPMTMDETIRALYAEPIYIPRLLPIQFDMNAQIQEVLKVFLDSKKRVAENRKLKLV